MSELSFDNNKTPLCEKHASDLEYAIQPQCQFCLTDKLSEYMLHGLEKYDDYEKLKAEIEELKNRVHELAEVLNHIDDHFEYHSGVLVETDYIEMTKGLKKKGGEG